MKWAFLIMSIISVPTLALLNAPQSFTTHNSGAVQPLRGFLKKIVVYEQSGDRPSIMEVDALIAKIVETSEVVGLRVRYHTTGEHIVKVTSVHVELRTHRCSEWSGVSNLLPDAVPMVINDSRVSIHSATFAHGNVSILSNRHGCISQIIVRFEGSHKRQPDQHMPQTER